MTMGNGIQLVKNRIYFWSTPHFTLEFHSIQLALHFSLIHWPNSLGHGLRCDFLCCLVCSFFWCHYTIGQTVQPKVVNRLVLFANWFVTLVEAFYPHTHMHTNIGTMMWPAEWKPNWVRAMERRRKIIDLHRDYWSKNYSRLLYWS